MSLWNPTTIDSFGELARVFNLGVTPLIHTYDKYTKYISHHLLFRTEFAFPEPRFPWQVSSARSRYCSGSGCRFPWHIRSQSIFPALTGLTWAKIGSLVRSARYCCLCMLVVASTCFIECLLLLFVYLSGKLWIQWMSGRVRDFSCRSSELSLGLIWPICPASCWYLF